MVAAEQLYDALGCADADAATVPLEHGESGEVKAYQEAMEVRVEGCAVPRYTQPSSQFALLACLLGHGTARHGTPHHTA